MVLGSGAGLALGVLLVYLQPWLGSISCNSLPVYAAVNESVTFHPSSHMPFQEILWKKQKNKVIEWENSEFKAFPPFKGRVNLDPVSGNLTIFNLTSSDEDEYEIESPSITSTNKFSLYVIEPIPSLTLTCTLTDQNIIVQCEILEHYDSHPELLKYSWDCPSDQCKNNSAPEMHFDRESDHSQKIQCTVSNKVSKRTSSIILATCFPSAGVSRGRFPLLLSVAFVGALVSSLSFFCLAKRR
ncbi:PREDICTED: lymphocyte function-associated antigen 3 isoform X2 [Propithecus coquereli]|uniref:lymphocyte function-associated antigen 3 isoform X2 n=1 Tax=Propithecus coquereli TaxID=379532 RepID=UPI00063FBBF8|nr:PREDICTED: lymphocyte function-associated antigen 3 isoform X2 [Propithecus coquereli]